MQITKSECIKAGAKEDDLLAIIGDITMKEVHDRLINETVQKFGKLDILVFILGLINSEFLIYTFHF